MCLLKIDRFRWRSASATLTPCSKAWRTTAWVACRGRSCGGCGTKQTLNLSLFEGLKQFVKWSNWIFQHVFEALRTQTDVLAMNKALNPATQIPFVLRPKLPAKTLLGSPMDQAPESLWTFGYYSQIVFVASHSYLTEYLLWRHTFFSRGSHWCSQGTVRMPRLLCRSSTAFGHWMVPYHQNSPSKTVQMLLASNQYWRSRFRF